MTTPGGRAACSALAFLSPGATARGSITGSSFLAVSWRASDAQLRGPTLKISVPPRSATNASSLVQSSAESSSGLTSPMMIASKDPSGSG